MWVGLSLGCRRTLLWPGTATLRVCVGTHTRVPSNTHGGGVTEVIHSVQSAERSQPAVTRAPARRFRKVRCVKFTPDV